MKLISLFLIGALLSAQTTQLSLGRQANNPDFSIQPVTKPVTVGTALPSGCAVGQQYLLTSGTTAGLYGCLTANTWTDLGPFIPPPGNSIGSGASLPSTCTVGQVYFTTSSVGIFGCTATNTWSSLSGSSSSAVVSASPTSLTFPTTNPGNTAAAQSVTLSDTGTSYWAVGSISITGTNASDFSITANSCGTQVGSGNNCTVSVSFSPTAPSGGAITWTETATLSAPGNQSGSPTTVALSGAGQLVNGGLVVTSSANTAAAGAAITITSNRSVTFALATGAVGTLTTVDATHATYTAPSTITVTTPVQGCQVYPNDSVLNTPINALPVHAQSTNWMSQILNYAVTVQPSYWQNAVIGTSPTTIARKFYYGAPSGNFPLLSWPNKKREGGFDKTGSDGADHHTMSVLVSPGSTQCTAYETYNDSLSPTYTYNCQNGSMGCNAQSGDIELPNSYVINTLTDAAGLPQYLTLRLDEIKNNAINHPIRFTFAPGFIQGSGGPQLWPAYSANNGYGASNNTLPYGARLRLKASVSISGHSTYATNILSALKNQGIILADIGTSGSLVIGTDIHADPVVEAAVNEAFNGLNFSSFEVVDESSLQVSANSLQANPANGYVTPNSSAIVKATDSAPVQGNTYSATIGVALQGVAIGLKHPQAAMLVGSYSYNFANDSWVSGQSSQTTTWTLVSGPGSVTSAGVYTPPTTVSAVTAVVLQAAAGGATVNQYINLYPFSTDGNFRVANYPVASSAATDSAGNTWQTSPGLETGIMQRFSADYPTWTIAGNLPDANIYNIVAYTYDDDMVYQMIVPNGNYRVRMLMGYPNNGCGSGCQQSGAVYTYVPPPLMIGVNGQFAGQSWLYGAAVGYGYQKAFDFNAPALVSNNNLYISLGSYVPDGQTITSLKTLNLAGFELLPDTTAAHLAIGTGQEAWAAGSTTRIDTSLTVPHGTTAQLYAVGWYMSNSVTWSVSGGGSISSGGLYTAPASGTATVTVTATSTVNSAVTATYTINVT